MEKLTVVRKGITQLPIFGLWKWRDADYETSLRMHLDSSTTCFFIEKDVISGQREPLTDPYAARLEITFQPAPAALLKGLESKGKSDGEAAQQIYDIYVKAHQRLDTLLRTSGGVTALLGLGPMRIHEFFGLGGLRVLPLTMSTQSCPIPDDHSGR